MTMKRFDFILFLVLAFAGKAFAQTDSTSMPKEKPNTFWSEYVLYNGDTIPLSYLTEVVVLERPTFETNEERRAYFRLRRKVLKVYPYAVIASEKLTEVTEATADLKKKRKVRKYSKKIEKYLREEFEAELKKLTRTEGMILIKLIYRQTGYTTWDLIKDYRGGINAVFYQTMAKFYDADLKATYDPFTVEEDAMIETILQRAFIAGELQHQETPVNFSDFRTNSNMLDKVREKANEEEEQENEKE